MAKDNKYTRKEEECPLIGQFCDCEEKDCDRCIGEEAQWQESQNVFEKL